MSLKTLIIHNSPILFEIFEEIKENCLPNGKFQKFSLNNLR